MTALKYPTMRSHLAKLEDILISPVFVHLSGPPVNRKSFILPLLGRRPKVATPLNTYENRTTQSKSIFMHRASAGLFRPSRARFQLRRSGRHRRRAVHLRAGIAGDSGAAAVDETAHPGV